MPKVTSLGHVGVYVRDIERSVGFYRDILGLQVSDRSPNGSVFMTAQDRAVEHHELLLAPGRDAQGDVKLLQQISFHCATLKDVKDFYRIFVDHGVPINRVASHGNTVSVYAQDPDGNSVEVYWSSGADVPQPFGKPMDLTKSDAEIREQLNRILTDWEQSVQK